MGNPQAITHSYTESARCKRSAAPRRRFILRQTVEPCERCQRPLGASWGLIGGDKLSVAMKKSPLVARWRSPLVARLVSPPFASCRSRR